MDQNNVFLSQIESSSDPDRLKNLIRSYITQQKYSVEGLTVTELVDQLYEYMAGFAFLRKYIYAPDTEEININAWDDIEIIRSGGATEKLQEKFASPQQAIDIIRRMLAPRGITLDNTTPRVLSNISDNVRIAVSKTPLVDEAVGLSASIRIVNQKAVDADKLLGSGSCTQEMLDFMIACIKYGVSVCIAGATGSGKTTIMAWLLSNVPDNSRLVTIEDGSREFNLIKRDEAGNAINSVVHLITRHHEGDDNMDIDQDDLLEFTLRMHPDVIGVGEIRAAKECMSVAEASRTGHTCCTTIHSNSAADSYRRMMTLAKRQNALEDTMLMQIMTEAFPVVVYTKQLKDRSRKIMEIVEAEGYANGELKTRKLYEYHTIRNAVDPDTGKLHIEGVYRRVGEMSEHLRQRLIDNGIEDYELSRIAKEVEQE